MPAAPLEALDYDAVLALAGAAFGRVQHLDAAELADLGLFPDLAESDRAPALMAPPSRQATTPAAARISRRGDPGRRQPRLRRRPHLPPTANRRLPPRPPVHRPPKDGARLT